MLNYAFFGLENVPGLGKAFQNVDFGGLFSGTVRVLTLLFVIAIVVGIFIFLTYLRRLKKMYNINIHLFEDAPDRLIPVKDFLAAEITIPQTNLRVFHIKEIDFYLTRGSKQMGKGHYWYSLLENGELVNFTLGSMNKELKKANLYYDHTDMRYADENLREIIKRSFRDKSTKWWKEYKDVITTVIYIFVMTLAFGYLLSKIGGLLDRLNPLLDHADQILQAVSNLQQTSGVRPA